MIKSGRSVKNNQRASKDGKAGDMPRVAVPNGGDDENDQAGDTEHGPDPVSEAVHNFLGGAV